MKESTEALNAMIADLEELTKAAIALRKQFSELRKG